MKLDNEGLILFLVISLLIFNCPNAFDYGFMDSPRNLLYGYTSAETNVSFTWTSRWQPEPQDIVNFSSIAGDHIIIRSSWDIPVESSSIRIQSGIYDTRTGDVAAPIDPDVWPRPLCCEQNYTWETFSGIHAGDKIRVSLNFSEEGDPAFDVWSWKDSDQDNEIDVGELGMSSLIQVDVGGLGVNESATFRSLFTQDIAIRVFCWTYAYRSNMTYILNVDTRESVSIENESGNPSEVIFDTYYLLRNTTANITLSASYDSIAVSTQFNSVTFGNYFVPHIEFVYPPPTSVNNDNSQFGMSQEILQIPVREGIVQLTWYCSDPNANDTNYYSVWLSSDGGFTFQLLAQNLTENHYDWNSTGFIDSDYIYRIRAYSLDLTMEINTTRLCSTATPPGSYWPGDYADVVTDYWPQHIIPVTSSDTTSITDDNPSATTDFLSPLLVLSIGISAGMISGIIVVEILRRKRITKIE
ncbi:MAG: hypothetical protein ACFFF9_11755 [Candidatus Thorarchaeota archaeon]